MLDQDPCLRSDATSDQTGNMLQHFTILSPMRTSRICIVGSPDCWNQCQSLCTGVDKAVRGLTLDPPKTEVDHREKAGDEKDSQVKHRPAKGLSSGHRASTGIPEGRPSAEPSMALPHRSSGKQSSAEHTLIDTTQSPSLPCCSALHLLGSFNGYPAVKQSILLKVTCGQNPGCKGK